MEFMTVDKNKCISCGACIAECPVRIISDGAGRLPAVEPQAEQLCIRCGHCVAVCPYAALSLESCPVEQCLPLAQGWQLSLPQVEALLKGRRSIRTFADKPVDRGLLERLIDTARYAPSGINRQPVRWKIVEGKERVHELAAAMASWTRELISQDPAFAASLRMETMVKAWEQGQDRLLRSAPAVVIAYGLRDDPLVPQACTIATAYLELAAVAAGLGGCWAGYLQMALNRSAEVRKTAGFSSKASCHGALMVGYPRYTYYRIPLRNAASIK